MNDRLNLHSAGQRIAQAGLVDDVRRVDKSDLTNRERRRDTDADQNEPVRRSRSAEQDDRREQPRRRRDDDERRRPASRDDHSREDDEDLDDDHQYSDDEYDGEDQDDSADHSNREDGEDGETDEDGADDQGGDQSREERLYEVKVGGQKLKVTETELKTGYMKGADYQNKTKELAGRRRDLDGHHLKFATELKQKMQTVSAIVDRVKRDLVGDMNSPQMQQLRASDPAQWSIARVEYQDRIEQVNRYFEAVQQEIERHGHETAKQQLTSQQTAMAAELELLQRAIPDWNEGKNDKPAARVALNTYLQNQGFSEAEIKAVADHRHFVIANKARLYDELMANQGRAQRKAKEMPRRVQAGRSQMQPPRNGQGGQRQQTNMSQYRSARQKAKQTGNTRDAAKAIEHLI